MHVELIAIEKKGVSLNHFVEPHALNGMLKDCGMNEEKEAEERNNKEDVHQDKEKDVTSE